MTRREDLIKLNEIAELRAKKLDEIREFLSISSQADDQEVLVIIKWWQKTSAYEPSYPTELKAQANHLFGEFRSINEANRQILDRFDGLGKRGS
jgi:hypothetical protein